MPLDKINDAVVSAARKEADRLVKAAERAAAEHVEEARRKAAQDAENRYQAELRRIEEEYQRKLTQVTGAGSKELLAAKNERVRQVFDDARRQILAMPEEEYMAIMKRLLQQATQGHSGRVRVHAEEAGRFRKALEQFKDVSLDESTPLPERGGFIFMSEKFQVDQTLGTLLTDLEHELAPGVASTLFSRQQTTG